MPENPRTCVVEEWCLSLLAPSTLSLSELAGLRRAVQAHLEACATEVGRTPSCSLAISPPGAPDR